jgi:hypothetical protein
MSLPVLLAYFDHCKDIKKDPELQELLQWKYEFNHR